MLLSENCCLDAARKCQPITCLRCNVIGWCPLLSPSQVDFSKSTFLRLVEIWFGSKVFFKLRVVATESRGPSFYSNLAIKSGLIVFARWWLGCPKANSAVNKAAQQDEIAGRSRCLLRCVGARSLWFVRSLVVSGHVIRYSFCVYIRFIVADWLIDWIMLVM